MNLYKVTTSSGIPTFFRSNAEAVKFTRLSRAACWVYQLDETPVSGKQLVVDLLNDTCSWTMIKSVKGKETPTVAGDQQVPAFTHQAPDGTWSHSSFATQADIAAGKARKITW